MERRNSPLEPMSEEDAPPPVKRRPVILSAAGLFGLLVFHFWLLGGWIRREDRPPMWDQAIHLEIAHDYAQLLARGDIGGVLKLAPKPGMPAFPPLYELTLVPKVEQPDAVTATLWYNYPWFAVLIVAVWGIGFLFAGPGEALAAAILVSCVPEAQWLTRNHLADMPLAAVIAACYFTCAWSAGFLRWPGSIAFGACVAAALLTKWSAWTYLFPLALFWVRSLTNRVTRTRALAAFAVAVVGCAPWYLAQYPMLLPRLIEASADQAVPIWRGWAILSYLWIMLGGFDTPLWALSLLAVLVPKLHKERDDNWLIAAWFLTSFVFWTIVPNRQMRFLYPAAAPLLLLVAGAFPRKLVALLCLWQLASAANYTMGWIPTVRLSFGQSFPFFSSELPVKEDWHVTDILRAAEARREAGRLFSNLTVVANDYRFNGPVFNWERKHAGVASIQIRGVNKRWCELSEFVVLKEGNLGPASVVNQLPGVRDAMLQEGSWFLQGYQEATRWKAPDGEPIRLFQRRRRTSPPWTQPVLRMASLLTPQYSASGTTLRFGPWDSKRGAYERVELSMDMLVLRGLEIRNLKAELFGADILPLRSEKGVYDVRLLRLERLVLKSAEVRADGVAALLARRIPALSQVSVKLDGTAEVSARFKDRISVVLEAAVRADADGLEARLERAQLGPIPLPLPQDLAHHKLSFQPSPELPFELKLEGLVLKDGRLSVGPTP